ncbi:MAG: hypothetical protein ACXAC8_02315, partial [Candidatus Hodarchaeales archaeon]
ELDEQEVEEALAADTHQRNKHVSSIDLQKNLFTIKETALSTAKKLQLTEESHLKQAIEIINNLFADESMETTKNKDKWNEYKKWYHKKQSMFSIYGEISQKDFIPVLNTLRSVFIVEFGIPSNKLFDQIKESNLSELLRQLLEVIRPLTTSNKEVKEWFDWFIEQADLYQQSKLENQIFRDMLSRSQNFFLNIEPTLTKNDEMKALDEIQALLSATGEDIEKTYN